MQRRRQERGRRRRDRRRSSAKRGYDAAWRRLRDAYVAEHPECEDCLLRGLHTPAREVDHVIPFQGLGDPLRLDKRNLRSLCRRHHARKTAADKRAARGGVGGVIF